MEAILPARETAQKKGWLYQVQWIEDGRVCFIRCTSGAEADTHADKIRKGGLSPVVIDLRDEMQIH